MNERPMESILVQQHYIELIRESASYYEKQAFQTLQCSKDRNERLAAAEEMDLWKAVQILVAQRDKLSKYVGLLINTEAEEQTVNAARGYLEQIGIKL